MKLIMDLRFNMVEWFAVNTNSIDTSRINSYGTKMERAIFEMVKTLSRIGSTQVVLSALYPSGLDKLGVEDTITLYHNHLCGYKFVLPEGGEGEEGGYIPRRLVLLMINGDEIEVISDEPMKFIQRIVNAEAEVALGRKIVNGKDKLEAFVGGLLRG